MRIKITIAFLITFSITMTLTSYFLFKQKTDSEIVIKEMKHELNSLMQKYTILKQEKRQ